MEVFEIVALVLLGLCTTLLILLLVRTGGRSAMQSGLEKQNTALRTELDRLQKTFLEQNGQLRGELSQANARLSEQLRQSIKDGSEAQQARLRENTEATERHLSDIRRSTNDSLQHMTEKNEKRLNEIREVVDEKLSATLNKRFAESFTSIGERLDAVNKGLGEMQTLASGVGDLKKVLTNVKTRGTWGEIQLGALLDQILSPTQYKANVKVKPRSEKLVEYAIVLPSKQSGEKDVFLPIDSKFPMESYQRLVQAREDGDLAAQDVAQKALCAAIKENARTIRDKYIEPPYTTDFAIMYLPTEGLYAFVAGDTSLLELLQREMRVTVMGPTTLGAFLNSLQMGFRTLAIQKQTSVVWKTIAGIRKDFDKFGGLLEKTKKNLDTASNTIDDALKRTDRIRGRLERMELEAPEPEELTLEDA